MTESPLIALGLVAALVLTGGAAFAGYRGRVRRRQRLASWNEVCLRLELTPQPGAARVAVGQLPDADFQLHDTGSEWRVEIPLPQPLLPRGVVLLPPRRSWLPWPRSKLYPLWWSGAASSPPGRLAWYAEWKEPPHKVEAPQPFLDEASRAAQAHAPLRVEPQRLVQSLSVGSQLSVSEVREAVRALNATARGWLAVATSHGIPRVQALNWPSARWLLREVLRQHHAWKWLRYLNLGIPITVGVLWWGGGFAFFCLLAVSLWLARRSYRASPFGVRGFGLGALMLATTFAAPWCWMSSVGRGTSPSVLSLREAANLPHRNAEFFRFRDGVIRQDLRGKLSAPVPVLPKDWKPGELVSVWATRFPSGPQGEDTLGGIAVERDVMRWSRSGAIKLARQHGMPMHSHAVFVDFTTHPDAQIREQRLLALLFWGVPNLLWLGWVLVRWRQKFLASRSPERLRLAR